MRDDERPEGVSLFEWPLTSEAERMPPGDLLAELIESIIRLNRDPQWSRTIIPPRFGDVVIDREAKTISARCMWKLKPRKPKEDE